MYIIAALIVVTLGLVSRKMVNHLPEIVNMYLGDALWALMIYLYVAGCSPRPLTTEKVVARVNGSAITADDFLRELERAAPMLGQFGDLSDDDIKASVLDNMVVNFLLMEQAQKKGLELQDSFRLEVQDYWRQALLKAVVAAKYREFMENSEVSAQQSSAVMEQWIKQLQSDAKIEIDSKVIGDMPVPVSGQRGGQYEDKN